MSTAHIVFSTEKENIINQIMKSMMMSKFSSIVSDGFAERELCNNFAPFAVKCAILCGEQPSFVIKILDFVKTQMFNEFQSVLEMGIILYTQKKKPIELLEELITRYPETDLHFNGDALLRIACSYGNMPYVQFLLKNGANPEAHCAIYNQNAFEHAQGRPEILELLNIHHNHQNSI